MTDSAFPFAVVFLTGAIVRACLILELPPTEIPSAETAPVHRVALVQAGRGNTDSVKGPRPALFAKEQ